MGGGTNEFSEVRWYPRGPLKLFGCQGLKIGAHFYLSPSAWLLKLQSAQNSLIALKIKDFLDVNK